MASSVSPRRRSSRRGVDNDDDTISPNIGLSKDETAFSVLRTYVLQDDFRSISDPDNVMKKIWIRDGKEKKDGVDGVDWIKEDGFTVKKYAEFWRNEMAELEDVIVEWGHKLPAEAKSHLDKSLFKDDDDVLGVEVKNAAAKVTPGPNSGKENKRKSISTTSKSSGKPKRRKKAKSDDNNDDKNNYKLTPELLALRKQWFSQLEAGHYKVGIEEASSEVKKTSSIKKRMAQAESTKNLFVHNVGECSRVALYKQVALDPLAKHIIAKVDAYVANQAAILRNEFLEDLVLSNYKFTEEIKVNATNKDKIKDTSLQKNLP